MALHLETWDLRHIVFQAKPPHVSSLGHHQPSTNFPVSHQSFKSSSFAKSSQTGQHTSTPYNGCRTSNYPLYILLPITATCHVASGVVKEVVVIRQAPIPLGVASVCGMEETTWEDRKDFERKMVEVEVDEAQNRGQIVYRHGECGGEWRVNGLT